MRLVIAAVAALTVIAGSATAQSNGLTAGPDLLANFSADTITGPLRDAGLTVERKTDPGGNDVLIVRTPDRRRTIIATPNACDEDGCAGLQLLAIMGEGTASLETVNAFNVKHVAVRARRLPQGLIALDRYLIGDGGTPKENLIVEMVVLMNAVNVWYDTIEGAGQVEVSFAPLMEGPQAPVPGRDLPEGSAHEAGTAPTLYEGVVNAR